MESDPLRASLGVDSTMNTHRFALGIMITLIGASLIYAIIMCAEIGIFEAWTTIRNDPGKFVFHTLLLPAAFGALISSVPLGLVRQCFGRNRVQKYLVATIGIALATLGLYIGVGQAIQGFEERPPVPTDVRALIVVPGGLSLQARAQLLEAWHKYHDPRWSPSSIRPNDKALFSKAREAGYKFALDTALGKQRDFWTQASVGAWWSALLTAMGVWLFCAWALLVIIAVLEREGFTQADTARLTLAFCTGVAALVVWFYLKVYSEWYIHFYHVPPVSFSPLIMAVLAAIILATAALLAKEARRPLTWFAALSAIGGVVTGVAAAWRPEILRAVADAYREAEDGSVIGLWILMGLATFTAIYIIGDNRDK